MEAQTQERQVLVVTGSPRKNGNSSTLAQEIMKGAEEEGIATKAFHLADLAIGPCRACYACQKKNSAGCALDDDMQSLYPHLLASEAWVLASPVYWFTMTAQMKLFMDRLFGLPAYGAEPFRRRKIAIAMTYGDSDPFNSGCVNALRTFQDAFRFTGSKIVGMVYGNALEPGDIEKNTELMEQARELGRQLVR